MKETLSDKIENIRTLTNHSGEKEIQTTEIPAVRTEDLKKAIKELKKDLERGVNKYETYPLDYCFNRIDEIFGNKLTEQEE